MAVLTSTVIALAAFQSIVSGLPAPQAGGAELDFVITEAEEPREGRVLVADIPFDKTSAAVAGFRLPLPDGLEDDVVVVEAAQGREAKAISDIPRDRNFGVVASPRLPLPDDQVVVYPDDDIVVIEAADGREAKSFLDIPRDRNFGIVASPRLPLPEDDVVVVEVAGDRDGRVLSETPLDTSAPSQAGFRLPLPGADTSLRSLQEDDFEIIEVGDYDYDQGRSLESAIPTDSSREGKAGFRLPKAQDDFVIIEAASGPQEPRVSAKTLADCLKPLTKSRCRASLVNWFYNAETGQCEEFSFGGCDSDNHSNRFETELECRQVCLAQ